MYLVCLLDSARLFLIPLRTGMIYNSQLNVEREILFRVEKVM